MSTLGDKVTSSIVNAVGKGAESAALAQHKAVKALIQDQIGEYLKNPNLSPGTRKQFEAMRSDSTIVDFLCSFIGVLGTALQVLFASGEPYAEWVKQGQWRFTPVRLPPEPVIIQGLFRGRYDEKQAEAWLHSLGYDAKLRDAWYVSQLKLLDNEEIRDLWLRGDINMPKVLEKLKAAGFSVEDQGLLQKLFWRLPPVQDIIRMAVREAFTPEIAEKFGQYQDLPAKFIEQAAKVGLSPEVATWYWAAHWDLPSISQGFEMLHRGVVSGDELDLLMRAQDVMPFWREKLKQISYSPYTRVDIRRMYHAGVLTEDGVYLAYRDIGYDEVRARNLVAFTKVYYGPDDDEEVVEERDFTKAEVLDGYRKGILSEEQTRLALGSMGYPAERVAFYLAREDLKASQELKSAYLAAFKALYVEGVMSAAEVTSDLTTLGISSEEANQTLSLWYLERIRKASRPTKAEVTRFVKAGIISVSTWRQEMKSLGYADQYVSWYEAELAAAESAAAEE